MVKPMARSLYSCCIIASFVRHRSAVVACHGIVNGKAAKDCNLSGCGLDLKAGQVHFRHIMMCRKRQQARQVFKSHFQRNYGRVASYCHFRAPAHHHVASAHSNLAEPSKEFGCSARMLYKTILSHIIHINSHARKQKHAVMWTAAAPP